MNPERIRPSVFAHCAGLLLIPAVAFVSAAETTFAVETILQPGIIIEENGGWSRTGSLNFFIHRAKGSLGSKTDVGPLTVKTKLDVDFSETKMRNLLKDATVAITAHPLLSLKAGVMKTPFGFDNARSATDLPLIYRSRTSDHIDNQLEEGCTAAGVILSGSWHDKIAYSLGLFNATGNAIDGMNIRDIADNPVAGLSATPVSWLTLSYMMAAPQKGVSMVDSTVAARRLYLHDIALSLTGGKRFDFLVELFLGPDTAEAREIRLYLDNYTESVSQSVYAEATCHFPLRKKTRLSFTSAFEYLNGLDHDGTSYTNRPYYYALTCGTRLDLTKKIHAEIQYDSRFDADFNPIHAQRIAAQITCIGRWHSGRESE